MPAGSASNSGHQSPDFITPVLLMFSKQSANILKEKSIALARKKTTGKRRMRRGIKK